MLRHYDRLGLLPPVYIDRFTGYRYYEAGQSKRFGQISALKKAGLSLDEIRIILSDKANQDRIAGIFNEKRQSLRENLLNLEEAEKIMSGERKMIETKTQLRPLNENIDLPFEDDDVVGRWEVLGEYAKKGDFFSGESLNGDGVTATREIYFLPGGERYWCFGWTKGRLLIDTGDTTSVNEYEVETHGGDRFMFVRLKSYSYRTGGEPTVLVLRRLDSKAYSADGIARKDNIDIPFANDKRVIGRWKAHSFCVNKTDFSPENRSETPLYFSEIEFFPGGSCNSVYGGEIIGGNHMQTWTKGYVLRRWNSSACRYEIKTVNGTDYLIIEWKSGDYRWGGFDTDYYVFERES